MGLHYHAEYGLGRGRRICRTYQGVPALVAIGVDLVMGLVLGVLGVAFKLLGYVWRLAGYLVVLCVAVLVELIQLPFRAARWTSKLLNNRSRRRARPSTVKPAWAGFEEL